MVANGVTLCNDDLARIGKSYLLEPDVLVSRCAAYWAFHRRPIANISMSAYEAYPDLPFKKPILLLVNIVLSLPV